MYSFGHNKEIATLKQVDDYLELELDFDKGKESMPYLEKYKECMFLTGINGEKVVIRITDTDIKDVIACDLTDLAKIKCDVNVSGWEEAEEDAFIHITLSERPYKKCVNLLNSYGLQSNKKKRKWWGNLNNLKCVNLITALEDFKYLNVCVEYK